MNNGVWYGLIANVYNLQCTCNIYPFKLGSGLLTRAVIRLDMVSSWSEQSNPQSCNIYQHPYGSINN